MTDAPTPWRLLQLSTGDGAHNMAVDQAIAECFPRLSIPTLRLYTWAPPCISIGRAQRSSDIRFAACRSRGIDVVRRSTGGRAILHDQELTYSLITAPEDPLVDAPTIVRSYARVHQALLSGLTALGLRAELAPGDRQTAPASAACFDHAAPYEIVVAGRKLVGSAQARLQGALLQQGTLLLDIDRHALPALLNLSPTVTLDYLMQHVVALNELLQPAPTFEHLCAALITGIETTWHIKLQPGELHPFEHARVHELLRERYANPRWTLRH
ncbi:MAG: octanoyltransferase LipM [Herpetosiphon sp.]